MIPNNVKCMNMPEKNPSKRRLFQHFVVFLVGAVLLIVLNVVIGYREDLKPLGYDWFVWAVLLWTFIFLIHLLNVLVIDSFMGKQWEQQQLERLVRKQRERIEELQRKVEKEHPEPTKRVGPSRICIRIPPVQPISGKMILPIQTNL